VSDLPIPDEQFTALQNAAQHLTNHAEQIRQQIEQQKTLARIIERIRSSLDLDLIFRTTACDVRQLLAADRVGVFRFTPGSGWDEGEFVSEDVAPGLASAIAAKVSDHCFGSQFAPHYRQGRVQAVADIHAAGLSDCHIQILEKFQVRANLIVPILRGDDLWGLLCIHQCRQARQWQAAEIEFVGKIANHFAIAVQQAEYLHQIQKQSVALEQTLQELKQSQAQLIQTEKMASLGQLVAGIAHEINNPVNFIYGNLKCVQGYVTDLLALAHLTRQSDPQAAIAAQKLANEIDIDFILADLPKTLTSMEGGANRIRQIVLSLRSFARLDEAEIKAVDLHAGIDSALLILGHRLNAGHPQSQVEVIKAYGELPLVECCPAQINQAFMNLLTNALDAIAVAQQVATANPEAPTSHPAAKIWISTQLNGSGQVEIRIRDNGIGIAENHQSKVFDYFFTTKPIGKGTGLGLSIAQKILVEIHGGTLTVTSTPGQGAEFVIGLPIRLTSKLPKDRGLNNSVGWVEA
jgi:signal transduction histidine kinase